MRAAATAVMVAILAVGAFAQSRAGQALTLYLIDVEGGNATLITAPSGESILIDTANGGAQAPRDVDRILAAAKDAGVTQIDHLITTHYHTDHIGAMQEFVNRFPVKHLYDHGDTVEPRPDLLPFVRDVYPVIYAKIPRTVVKPGDRIPVKGLDVRVPTSAGLAIKQPLPGAGKPNPYCAQFTPVAPDPGENAQSVGTHITFGRFRMLHLGDLTAMKEFDLMCPANRLGTVDLLVVSHHGQAISNSQVLVHPLEARAMLMNNGIRKGGQPEAMRVLHSAPGLEDIWQLHFSQLSGQEYTVPGLFIANMVDTPQTDMPIAPFVPPARGTPGATPATPPPTHNGQAYWLKAVARDDGSFTVTNARNGFTKTYAARTK